MFRNTSSSRRSVAAAAAAAATVSVGTIAIAQRRQEQQQQPLRQRTQVAVHVDASPSTLLNGLTKMSVAASPRVAFAASVDYASVRRDLVKVLESTPSSYDDGSYGPLFVRLAWHASGTYDVNTKTGGSEGATMRFPPESTDGANAGLALARQLLAPIKEKYPELSYADLWTLAGSVAIEELGGPTIKWRPGRKDAGSDAKVVENGRLPDAAKGADHVRNVFYRQGFNDREIVALVGAHALGRCHTNRSGFDGPWTKSPTVFSNEYFQQLLEREWVQKQWNGPRQFVNKDDGSLMMLPADLALIEDPAFRKLVEEYAKDEAKFFQDFAAAWLKLVENGVPAFEKKGWFGLW